jgi:hypothetical protein
MQAQAILFLHGFGSSARATKSRYFRERLASWTQAVYHAIDFNPTPVDFEYVTATGLINRLRQYLLDHDLQTVDLIGSSFGGLVATHYAHRYGGVRRMFLLAPALRWRSWDLTSDQLQAWEEAGATPMIHFAFDREIPVRFDLQVDGMRYLEPAPPAAPALILHGRKDESVPVADSRQYAAEFPDRVRLHEIDAGHDLNDHLPMIWDQLRSFLLES